MLTHPTLDLFHDLGLHRMAKGFKDLEQATETRTLKPNFDTIILKTLRFQ
jgi:hypothetical protein